MRYLMLIHQDENNMGDPANMQAVYAQWGAFNEALAKAQGAAPGERMQPPSAGKTVRVRDGQTGVVDGPYSEAKEQLGFVALRDLAQFLGRHESDVGAAQGLLHAR